MANNNNQINFSLNFDTKRAETGLNQLSTTLNNIPVVGQKASASIQRVSKSLSAITKMNPAILAVGAGVGALGTAALLSYKNSEKLQTEISKLKTITLAPINKEFKALGDFAGSVVGRINEGIEKIQILNGHGLDNLKQSIADVSVEFSKLKDSLNSTITLAQAIGGEEGYKREQEASAQRYRLAEEESKKKIELLEEELKTKNDLRVKHESDIRIQLGKVEKAKKSGNQYADGSTEQERQQYKLNQMQATYQALLKDIATLEEQKALAIKEGVNAVEQQQKIQQELNKDKTTSVKVEKDLLEQLREQLAQVKKIRVYENDLNDDNLDNEDEKQRYYERQLQSLNQQKSIVNAIYNEERSRGIVNEKTKADYEELERLIEEIKKKMGEVVEETKTWEDYLRDATQITASIHSTINSLISSAGAFGEKSLASYTKAINEAQAKITAFNKWKEEEGDAEYENYLERLNKEYEIAKKVGDKMTMLAIENKKKELEKDKQITEQEKALEKELAIAEYNKSYAEWQNEVASAKTQKAMAIVDAIMMPLVAIGNSAVGISKSFADGGLIGVIAGTAASIGIIASAVSGAAGVKSASNSYDNVAASPPTPPAFRFGTTGYQLDNGQSAIVGETGAEVIRNMAGKLVVESNAQAKAMGRFNEAGMYIEQVIFNVSSIVDKKTIYKAMNEYKQRDSFAYTR